MNQKIQTKIPFLSKISLILFGVFISSTIFAFSIKILQETGIYIGLLISIIIIFLGFYYTKKGTALRLITWGILGTVILGTTTYIIAISTIKTILDFTQ